MREKLKTLMEDKHYSVSSVAKSLGISHATLSLWLNDKYKGKSDKISDAVNNFIEKEYARSKKLKINLVKTSVLENVFEVANACHINNEIGVCYGEAGLGKTVAVKEYASKNTDVILIEADPGYNQKIILTELHKRLGFSGSGNTYSMMCNIVEKLKFSGRLIIVDEAENLPYKALEVLRRIYDKAEVGILLVGMPRLIENLKGTKWQYAQLYSRVGVSVSLQPLLNIDVKNILIQANINDRLYGVFRDESYGNTRVLKKLILRSVDMARTADIDVDENIVSQAARVLIK